MAGVDSFFLEDDSGFQYYSRTFSREIVLDITILF